MEGFKTDKKKKGPEVLEHSQGHIKNTITVKTIPNYRQSVKTWLKALLVRLACMRCCRRRLCCFLLQVLRHD